jgi:hypothetical protein
MLHFGSLRPTTRKRVFLKAGEPVVGPTPVVQAVARAGRAKASAGYANTKLKMPMLVLTGEESFR